MLAFRQGTGPFAGRASDFDRPHHNTHLFENASGNTTRYSLKDPEEAPRE